MASLSSNSFSASKKYDVFISFRGTDTRYNFTAHLAAALSRHNIRVCLDYDLNRQEEISLSLMKAIEDSYGSVIIFSENYASSKWCLRELVKILECKKQGHFVIPVYYDVDPSDVLGETGSYLEALDKHERYSENRDELQLWKTALTEAAHIAGWHCGNNGEFEIINNIVNDILQNHLKEIWKFEDSLQIFRLYAFGENHPKEGYEEIEQRLVRHAQGLPLKLKILGSFLRFKPVEEWENALEKLRRFPHDIDDIEKVLSYDGSPHDDIEKVPSYDGSPHDDIDKASPHDDIEKASSYDGSPHDDIENASSYDGSRLHRWGKSLLPIQNIVEKQLIKPTFWRFAGSIASAAGLLCFALSLSFHRLFGKWNIWKIFLYGTVSFVITGFMFLPKNNIWQRPGSMWWKVHILSFVFVLTALGSFIFEKVISGKPDRLGLSSIGLFSLSSLSLSRQIDIGFEVGFTNFLLATFTGQIMRINEYLLCIPIAIFFAFALVRLSLESGAKETGTRSSQEHDAEETTTGSNQEHGAEKTTTEHVAETSTESNQELVAEETARGSNLEHVVDIAQKTTTESLKVNKNMLHKRLATSKQEHVAEETSYHWK